MSRICILTAGHLATCPRMVKAADALSPEHDVRVVSTRSIDWASAADASVRRGARWRWEVVPAGRDALATYVRTGVRQRTCRAAARWLGAHRIPSAIAVRALGRTYDELVASALSEAADLYYGGTAGGFAAAAEAARTLGVPYAVDLEDFHSGEGVSGCLENDIAAHVERRILGSAAFITAGSEAIADKYCRTYGVHTIAVHNTFSLPDQPPDFVRTDPATLQIYWFGQTVGLDRGLQQAIAAVGACGIRARLVIRGNTDSATAEALHRLRAAVAPRAELAISPPAPPADMIECCRGFDVGLSLEQPVSENRALTLTNKALTYPLAGLAVALTDTPGQTPFARSLGEGAIVCGPGDVDALALGLKRWADDGQLLLRARRAAWCAARTQWNWDSRDRPALIGAVARVLR